MFVPYRRKDKDLARALTVNVEIPFCSKCRKEIRYGKLFATVCALVALLLMLMLAVNANMPILLCFSIPVAVLVYVGLSHDSHTNKECDSPVITALKEYGFWTNTAMNLSSQSDSKHYDPMKFLALLDNVCAEYGYEVYDTTGYKFDFSKSNGKFIKNQILLDHLEMCQSQIRRSQYM